MANPLPNEKEIYEKIQKDKLAVPAEVWELISHHIGNDISAISLIVGSHVFGDGSEDIPAEHGKKVLAHCEQIKLFLNRLKKATHKDLTI